MNNLVCVFASEPIFNQEKVKAFEKLSVTDTIFFYSLLLANFIELFADSTTKYEKLFFINKLDQHFVPKSFFPENYNFHFIDFSKLDLVYENLDRNIFASYNNLLLIHSNTIGIRKKDITRTFGMLASEENSVVIGKSLTNEVIFSAHNNLSKSEFESFFMSIKSFDKHLSEVSRRDNFINVYEKFISLSTFIDFKILYSELSTKDSLEYCSEQMHERFTNLFIEYKDQLK